MRWSWGADGLVTRLAQHFTDFAQTWADVKSIEIPVTQVADPVAVWTLTPE